jgi:hypothetical protein
MTGYLTILYELPRVIEKIEYCVIERIGKETVGACLRHYPCTGMKWRKLPVVPQEIRTAPLQNKSYNKHCLSHYAFTERPSLYFSISYNQ